MMEADEREQYLAAIRGDRDAFEMIIRAQGRPLFAIAYGILQNPQEAEDVVQDALVKAWKSRWRVRDPEKFPAWLATIARHRAADFLRRRKPLSLDQPSAEFATPSSASDAEPDEREQQLQLALAALPALHRAAISLRYLENMDYATIERTLGLSNGALRGILGRALAMLRKQMKPVTLPA